MEDYRELSDAVATLEEAYPELMKQAREMFEIGLVVFRVSESPGSAEESPAAAFARELSTRSTNNVGDHYLTVGCRWAAAMDNGSTVIASVRMHRGGLEGWVQAIKEDYGRDYGLNPNGAAVDKYYKGGKVSAAAHNGMP